MAAPSVLKRVVLAVVGSAGAILWVIVNAIPYGGTMETLRVSSSIVIFLFGWAALPAVRRNRFVGVIAALCWTAVTAYLCTFDLRNANGWLVGPWIWASLGIGLCLIANPPEYIPIKSWMNNDSDV